MTIKEALILNFNTKIQFESRNDLDAILKARAYMAELLYAAKQLSESIRDCFDDRALKYPFNKAADALNTLEYLHFAEDTFAVLASDDEGLKAQFVEIIDEIQQGFRPM